MTYDDNNVVAWPKAGQRTAMEDMFHSSGLKGSVLWALFIYGLYQMNISYYL